MNEIAAIISALAGVIISISGLVLAMSKLGPFMTALNKVLADQHKRALEAKKQPTIDSPKESSLTGTSSFRHTLLVPLSMNVAYTLIFSIVAGVDLSPHGTQVLIVQCVLYGVVITVWVMVGIYLHITNVILRIASNLND
jgi:hypothetical protein